MDVQSHFLNYARRQKVPLVLFLVNGVKLQGVLSSFDNHTLIIKRDASTQLIYKHAISTIVPQWSMGSFMDPGSPGTAASYETHLDPDQDEDHLE